MTNSNISRLDCNPRKRTGTPDKRSEMYCLKTTSDSISLNLLAHNLIIHSFEDYEVFPSSLDIEIR